MVQHFPGQMATAPSDQFMADRAISDVDDPDLGAAAMEEDDATGGGGERAGGSSRGGLGDWPDDDEEEDEPHHSHDADKTGASTSAAPTVAAGAPKCRADARQFGSRPEKIKTWPL